MEEYLKMSNSKKDDDYNFIRKGKVGSYTEELTPEIIEKFNAWILKKTEDLKIDPELLSIFMAS